MNKFSIKSQEEKDECLMWISDLYKDVYGIRPRGYNFHEWSFNELAGFVNDLSQQAEDDRKHEEKMEKEAEIEFNKRIQEIIELGAGDKKTALRWLFSGDEYDQGEYVTDWDVDCFLYGKGIVHSDLGKEVKKELLEIYC